MSRQAVPAYGEDGVWIARGFWALVATVLLLFLFNPFGWNEVKPTKPDVSTAKCWEIPVRYGGGTFCSDMKDEGNHGYVNPGSLEWEIE